MLYSIPYSLPRRLSQRISSTLFAIDYVHKNSYRISQKVSVVLRVPANNLRLGLRHSVESLNNRRTEALKVKDEGSVARKYFANLIRESNESKRSVEAVDLEGVAPGVGGAYESGPMV